MSRFFVRLERLDHALLSAPRAARAAAFAVTALAIVITALPHVPRPFVDYRGLPLVAGISQPETFGPDSLADMYEARVVLNDPFDMYTKRQVEQTPLEAATWTKEASAPYPPAVLLAEAGLYALGGRTDRGFYGLVLGLAALFVVLSALYFWRTRWYLFPLLYLNFVYFAERFVYVQDGSYLVMLTVVMAALLAARAGRTTATHLLMALATVMKLSPLYYARSLPRMPRLVAAAFAGVLVAGLVAPVFVFENYLYIYAFSEDLKGSPLETAGAVAIAVPFALVLWYVDVRRRFDLEDLVGWGLVPFALFLGFKMNVARHLLIVLLVPDKRGARNVAAAIALALPVLLPGLVRQNSALAIATVVLAIALYRELSLVGWDEVRDDLRNPGRTMRMLVGR